MKKISKFKQDLIDLNYEVKEDKFLNMLEVLPPTAIKDGSFLVGEPYCHSHTTGLPIYDCYIEQKNKYYYGGRMSIREFNKHF